MRKILCNHCGAIGYSAASAAHLKGGCGNCGAMGRLANLVDQQTIVLDEEFVFGPTQFAALIAAVDQTAGLLGDQYLAGFGALLQHKQDEIRSSDEEISLAGIEMIAARVKNLHYSLSRIADIELPDGAPAESGLVYLGILRTEFDRLINAPKAAA